MRRGHLETLAPVCPVCRRAGRDDAPLTLVSARREADGHVVEGTLHCSHALCRHEYPIIDGVPVIVADLRRYLNDNMLAILARTDLDDLTEGLLGDALGPGSALDTLRQQLSCYAWDHYAHLDPREAPAEPRPGAVLQLLNEACNLLDTRPVAPSLEAGCSVGGASFAIAGRTGGMVLGVDLNFAMLRLAARVLREGRVCYPRRRVGLVYDRRDFTVDLPHAEQVDFWACDVAEPPFASAAFGLAVGLNLLDSVNTPVTALVSIARLLGAAGRALLACPYDWSPGATPVEGWIGGHSQRGDERGESSATLRRVLSAHSGVGLQLLAERDPVPWHVRVHDRSVVHYASHVVMAGPLAPAT